MERESLKAVFSEAAASRWSLDSDIQLQRWLESFSNRLVQRTDSVAKQVRKLVEETFSTEQDLHNTFNHFRSLSNSQFIENRVYEEDETSSPTATKQHPDGETESYEGGIVPRYKEAVLTAWRVLEEHKIASNYLSLAEPDQASRLAHRPLPFVIGTEEYFGDAKCGLTDLSVADSDSESNGTDLATDMVDRALPPEVEWSDSSDVQAEGLEPAVSAALDFKAMLEAALRGPSLSYAEGENTVPNYSNSSGFFGDVDDTNTIARDPKSLDVLQRTMSENRKQSIAQEDQEDSGASSNDGTSANPTAPRTLGRQYVPVTSTSTVNAKEELQELESSQFEFPSTSERNQLLAGTSPSVQNDSEILGSRFSRGDTSAKHSSSLFQFPSTFMEYAPLGSDPTPGSIAEPTVPEDMFRSSKQSRTPETLANKSSDSKGSLQESALIMEDSGQPSEPRSQSAHQRHRSLPATQPPDYPIQLTSNQVTRTTSVSNRPPQQQFHGGLFDEDEDDSYVAQLMRQKDGISNQIRSARPWGKIAAGKGLFDKSDGILSSAEDEQGHLPFQSEASGLAFGDRPAPTAESFVAPQADPGLVKPMVVNDVLADARAVPRQQPVATEDDTTSWSSTDESHTSVSNAYFHDGLAVTQSGVVTVPHSISRLHSQTQSLDTTRRGSQNTSLEASRSGMPYVRPDSSLFQEGSSGTDMDANQLVTATHQFEGKGLVSTTYGEDNRSTGMHTVSSEAAIERVGSLSRESGEHNSRKESSGRRFVLFGDDDDDDDGDDTNFGTKRGKQLGQGSRAADGLNKTNSRHVAGQTSGSVHSAWDGGVRKLSARVVSEDTQGRFDEPMPTMQQADARSKNIGSAYLSSILFGDDEENEDELFGSFSKGPSRTRTALDPLAGRHSSSISSKDTDGSKAFSKLATDFGMAVDPEQLGTRGRSLFDD